MMFFVKKLISLIVSLNFLFFNFLPFVQNGVKTVSAQEETTTTESLYTAGGQRIAKIESGGVHTYYLPGVEVIIDEDGSVTYRR